MYTYRRYQPPKRPHVFVPTVILTQDQTMDVRLWCIEQFGAPGCYDGGGRYAYSEVTFQKHGFGAIAFRDEADAFAFRMRWC